MTDLKSILSNMKIYSLILVLGLFTSSVAFATKDEKKTTTDTRANVATGMASWYGHGFHGKKTSTGDVFHLDKMTCASNQYPLGTWLRVTNVKNGRSVLVRVNDRMHPRMKRIVDLSKGAAMELKMVSAGVAKVMVENLGKKISN